MFLDYGVNQYNELIHIEQAGRGLTELVCPYCGGQLLARKGEVKIHHFAHAGETCREVASRDENALRLPLYDKFDLGLSPKEIQYLHSIHGDGEGYSDHKTEQRLKEDGFIAWNDFAFRGSWELTHLGKIPVGAATLQKFAELQLERLHERHAELENAVSKVWRGTSSGRYGESTFSAWINPEAIPSALADLNIYRAQLHRIFGAKLYFLEIEHAGGKLYKVGITSRSIEERMEEIQRDLSPHLTDIAAKVLREFDHRGGIEFYFKHRYKAYQYKLNKLTEYFLFEDRRQILSDLSRMGDYEPDSWIEGILKGEASDIEQQLLDERQQAEAQAHDEKWRKAISRGMREAAASGQVIGRPSKDKDTILAEYPQVVELLGQGVGIREVSRLAGVARNTVRKVKAALDG